MQMQARVIDTSLLHALQCMDIEEDAMYQYLWVGLHNVHT